MTQQLDRARLLVNYGRYADAQKEIHQYLTTEPNDGEAHTLLAIIFLNLQKTDEAKAAIETAISFAPSDAYNFYVYSKVWFQKENLIEAEQKIREAISINPFSAEYFAWLAQIQMNKKDYYDALTSANEGLAVEADNINCLNIRAIALTKLNKKEEAYQTIKDALTGDPENSMTHANTGWSMLEHGDHKASLNHFTESLRLDPTNDWAKSGMVEALKARYFIYRMFLRYMFWISNMKGKRQWMVIGGLYLLVQVLKVVGRTMPSLQIIIIPIVVLYAAFAFSSWIIQPVFNLLLRLHPQGKYALTREERISSDFVGISLLTGALALIAMPFVKDGNGTFALAIFGITYSLPLACMFRSRSEKKFNLLQLFILIIGLCGASAVIMAFMGYEDYFFVGGLYLILIFIFQFVANSVAIR
ncbi:MAG: tetratricopeptide repeat protein [Bacteroidia bacterium]